MYSPLFAETVATRDLVDVHAHNVACLVQHIAADIVTGRLHACAVPCPQLPGVRQVDYDILWREPWYRLPFLRLPWGSHAHHARATVFVATDLDAERVSVVRIRLSPADIAHLREAAVLRPRIVEHIRRGVDA